MVVVGKKMMVLFSDVTFDSLACVFCSCVCSWVWVQSPCSSTSGSLPKKSVSKGGVSSSSKTTPSSTPSTTSPLKGQSKGQGVQKEEVGGELSYCLPWVEACALVTMCSYRSVTRRLSLVLLKEIRSLHNVLQTEVGGCG